MHEHRPTLIEQQPLQASAIDLRYLRYVIAAVELHSFRRAGASLNIHPSAISRRIQDLETRLGAPLFVRTSTGVTVTREGRAFVDRARPALEALNAASETIFNGTSRELRIGVSSAISPNLICAMLERLASRHPSIQEVLCEGRVEDHLAAIRSHQLDIAIIAGHSTSPTYHATPVWTEDLFVIVPSGHPLASRPAIALKDLGGQHLLISQDEPAEAIEGVLQETVEASSSAATIERCGLGRLAMLSQVIMGRHLGLCAAAATAINIPGICFRPIAQFSGALAFSAISLVNNNKQSVRRFLQMAHTLGS